MNDDARRVSSTPFFPRGDAPKPPRKIKARLHLTGVFQELTADELVAAYEEWKLLPANDEAGIQASTFHFESDKSVLRLSFLYATEGIELKARRHTLQVFHGTTEEELAAEYDEWATTAEERVIAPDTVRWSFPGPNIWLAFLYATE